mmetsp:Transcript_30192/g.72477  ORF Transcript_30192/g.72477 Transcript_30192/m.72477 type:complete len:205 (-) Transcript_30192:237-851(-)
MLECLLYRDGGGQIVDATGRKRGWIDVVTFGIDIALAGNLVTLIHHYRFECKRQLTVILVGRNSLLGKFTSVLAVRWQVFITLSSLLAGRFVQLFLAFLLNFGLMLFHSRIFRFEIQCSIFLSILNKILCIHPTIPSRTPSMIMYKEFPLIIAEGLQFGDLGFVIVRRIADISTQDFLVNVKGRWVFKGVITEIGLGSIIHVHG